MTHYYDDKHFICHIISHDLYDVHVVGNLHEISLECAMTAPGDPALGAAAPGHGGGEGRGGQSPGAPGRGGLGSVGSGEG